MHEKTERAILALVLKSRVSSPETQGKIAANIVLNDIFAFLNDKGWSVQDVTELRPDFVENLSDLIYLRSLDILTTKHVKELIPRIWDVVCLDLSEEFRDSKILEEAGADQIAVIIDELIEKNPKVVKQYHDGKTAASGFFVGGVMKAVKGKGNPAEISALVIKRLSEKGVSQ